MSLYLLNKEVFNLFDIKFCKFKIIYRFNLYVCMLINIYFYLYVSYEDVGIEFILIIEIMIID